MSDEREKRMSEKQSSGNIEQWKTVLDNNKRNETSATDRENFWSSCAMHHSQFERLIWKNNSVRYNTTNTWSCKHANASQGVLKYYVTLRDCRRFLSSIDKTHEMYVSESWLIQRLEVIFILNKTSY